MSRLQTGGQQASEENIIQDPSSETPPSHACSPAMKSTITNVSDASNKNEPAQIPGANSTYSSEECNAEKGVWLCSEERFFFEYIRISGDRSQKECCQDIATSLRTKSLSQVLAWYDGVVKQLRDRYAKHHNWENVSQLSIHRRMTDFYDTLVVCCIVCLFQLNSCLSYIVVRITINTDT